VDDGAGGEIDSWEDVTDGLFPATWRRKMTRFDSTIDNVENKRVLASETAVVTVRYTQKITSVCRVARFGDEAGWWEIIGTPERSVDGGWLEFTVERKAAAM
jgi:head-tail adaptor